MANAQIVFTPKRSLVAPSVEFQRILATSLTTDNITSVIVTIGIDVSTPATGNILLQDDLGVYRFLHYSSWSSSTFTIDTTDGNEDFAIVNATAPTAVWVTDLDPNDTYNLSITLSAFDRQTEEKSSSQTTLDGTHSKSLYFYTETYQCETVIGDVASDIMEMFFKSVIAGEQFTMTNIDDAERIMDCQLTGRPSRSRNNPVNVDFFSYSFVVREITEA